MTRPDTRAAPPDDGHQGSYTRPEDVLLDAGDAEQLGPTPPLSSDVPDHPHARGPRLLTFALVVLFAAAVLAPLFYWLD